MSEILIKANQVINEAVITFLGRINDITENGPYKKSKKIHAAFPLLKLGNNEFYEYAYFERTLEWFTRDLLINNIFRKLFSIHNIDSKWPNNESYVRYSTEAIETIFPFEFIFTNNGKKVGVRYTSLDVEDCSDLIRKYQINKIIYIKWDDSTSVQYTNRDVYEAITPADFFKCYLSIAEYNLFITKTLQAIEVANNKIGFETIPRLSLHYLSDFKAEISTFLKSAPFELMRFKVLPETNEKKSLTDITFTEDDYKTLDYHFKEKGLYKALLGTESFAKCFITAEYQFHIFKQGHNFDYTSVVCGYLKAIEQLLYKFMKIRMNSHPKEDLWIKCKSLRKKQRDKLNDVIRPNPDPKSNATQILLTEDNESFFDTTLTPLIWFIYDDINGWHISDSARNTIHAFLINFANECRNDHFHKDNINTFDEVDCIRNNTLLLFYLLLGGYRLTGSNTGDITALGIADDSFDRMYKKIQEIPRGVNKFIVYFDGQKPIKAYRHYTQEPTIFDANGSVATSKIKFVSVNEFNSYEYNRAMQGECINKEFVLQRDNMPSKICYINGFDKEVFINW